MEINRNNLGHWAISEELFDWIVDRHPPGINNPRIRKWEWITRAR